MSYKARKQYQVKISNRYAALGNLNDSDDINRDWENIKENTKISDAESLGLYDQNQQSPWLDTECSNFLEQRKQAKLQWLHDSDQSNVGNLNNCRCETNRHHRN